MIPFELKVVLMATLYVLLAMMFYRNETLQHPEDRIGDPVIAKALALLWPMVVLGVVVGTVVRIGLYILAFSLPRIARALDWAAQMWINYRKPACPTAVPSPNL